MKENKGLKISLICIGVLVLALSVALAVILAQNVYTLDLTMEGPGEITLEYGETYQENGAHAWFSGTVLEIEGFAVEVTTEGTVDVSKVGSYVLTYRAAHKDLVETATRTVHVVDTKSPEITLTADPEYFTFPGQTYEEEGFLAWDEYDGDITHLVVRTETESTVTYTVADSSGNQCMVERSIVYDDPVAPEIELLGEEVITISQGMEFEDPGVIASDNCDGDITDRVTVTTDLDTYIDGTYTVTYTVEDSYGNVASASRTVEVTRIWQGSYPTNGRVIYLTFDDGPGGATPRLLEILAKYNVKATFFVCNTGYVDYLGRIAAGGHSIGIHSVSHRFEEIYASEEAFFEDLYAMQAIIYNHTGIMTTLMRFPGGSSNTSSYYNPGIMSRLVKLVEEKGFQYFDWNVASGDAGDTTDTMVVFQNVIDGVSVRNVSVVLQHDSHGYSVDAVERIIVWGIAHGYTFLPLNPSSPGCHHGTNN